MIALKTRSFRHSCHHALLALAIALTGGTATADSMVVLGTSVSPGTLVADASNAYYTASGKVFRLPLSGGTPTQMSIGIDAITTSIGLTGSTLYWVTSHGIQAAATPAGTPSVIFPVSLGSVVSPQALAVGTTLSGGADLFFANEITANLYHITQTGSVWTGVKLLPNSRPGSPGFWYPYSVAVDATNVYMTAFTGEVWSLPRSTSTQTAPTILASGIDSRSLIATDGTRLYYVRGSDIVRLPVAGGSEQVFYAGAGTLSALAVVGSRLYWGSTTIGTVMRKPLSGGVAVTLVSGVTPATLIAADASRAYFTLSGSLLSLSH